jgi:uronate dehydrogenase
VKTVLITGAAGDIGTHLRRELAGVYQLRLSDIRPIERLAPGETFEPGDITDLARMVAVSRGADAIVHLGGVSAEAEWDRILQGNIIGCYNVFEAARSSGVKRVLFATSNHAVGFYRRDQTIDHRVYAKPDSRYGVSKVFGEALGSLYADKYGMEVFCMRIGIEHPDIRFEIVYGVSANKRGWYDNANAARLGYRPQDDSEIHAQDVLAREKPGDPTAEMYQGGAFVVAEEIPNPAPLARLRKRALRKS